MMLTLRCSPADLIAFLVRLKLTVRPRLYASLLIQVTANDAWAVYADSDRSSPLAIAGIAAFPERESEAWFMVDGARARRAMPECLAALRRVLRAEAPRHARGIIARVAPGNRAGETVARALGFAPEGGEIWSFAWSTSSRDYSEGARKTS